MYFRDTFRKKKTYLLAAISVSWLLICQALFYSIQHSNSKAIVKMMGNQLRQELDYGNFQYLARSGTDLVQSGIIRCLNIRQVSPAAIDVVNLNYMSTECSSNAFFLSGLKNEIELAGNNGSRFKFSFIASNERSFYFALWSFRFFGMILITALFWIFEIIQMHKNQMLSVQLEKSNILYKVALQVAHDIRSPLSVLKILEKKLLTSDDEINLLFLQSIQKIESCAKELLLKAKSGQSAFQTQNREAARSDDSFELETVVMNIFGEKKFVWSSFSQIEFNIAVDRDRNEKRIVFGSADKFARILSNILNNAFEAIEDKVGSISIAVNSQDETYIRIAVVDTGKGISQGVLSQLGDRPVSHGKENVLGSGNGLGIFDAKSNVSRWGGKLLLHSEVGLGTKVEIYLRKKT